MNLIKRISLPRMAIGLVGIALALMLVFGVALAQTETTAQTTIATDIPQELVSLAQDLGCQTVAQCAEKFDANFEQGITLAQKYDIYTPEEKKLAATFQTEVLERLRTVSQDNFEEEILNVLVDGKTVKVSIQTDNKGQYIEVNGSKYYLSKLVYSK